MGISIFSKSSFDDLESNHSGRISKSSYDKSAVCLAEPPQPRNPNPVPTNFKILNSLSMGDLLIIEVYYPDCTNYEGKKILVYENTDVADLVKQGSVDPHFSESKKFKSPIARFEPTERGMQMAAIFCAAWGK